MELLLAGLAGVVLGALVASSIIFAMHRKRADRDWLERQLRACSEYRDCLGDIESAFARAGESPEVLEQAWVNVRAFCREFRSTGWLFSDDLRLRIGSIVDALEREDRARSWNGNGASERAAQILCEKYHEIDRILRSEAERRSREFRRRPT